MAVLQIRTVPDPVLRRKAKRISIIDRSIKKLISDMLETLHAVPGRAGLAAPQVGKSLCVIVIGIPDEQDADKVRNYMLVNPEIVKTKGERIVSEGCLSIPGYIGEIKRAEIVTAKGKDQNGKPVRIRAEGLLAQALEHEIDHINGVLYIDHLESPDKLRKIEPEDIEEGETDGGE
jgi:peptide deformylase